MDKEKWIESNTSGFFKEANKDIITFIADILYSNPDSDTIYNLFANGYCYYFALMLKNAFNRGTICWHRNYSHIVWVDDDNIAYDINGVFYDYDNELLPVEILGDMIVDFKHTQEYCSGNIQFKDWCDHYNMSECYAISDIYKNMPEYDDSITVPENALLYWTTHEAELSEYYNKITK